MPAVSGPNALRPDWPVPDNVRAVFTLRGGGVSVGPCASLNVGAHVQDDPQAVAENRRRIAATFALPSEPAWLTQVHGTRVVRLEEAASGTEGDGVVTAQPSRVCAIQVADCLPVLFAARDGSVVGAAHAGWRGLAAGVLEQTVAALGVAPSELLAWIGPGIGPQHFEVGPEVREAFVGAGTGRASQAAAAFIPNLRGRWLCDLVALSRQRLTALGVLHVHGGRWCTFADAGSFFSHRRDGRSGRMAALIWLAQAPTNEAR
jgi:purine-nucleoside/S-methyl-5'-thioadenosine phosphorylase / adenosine deaminase